MKNIYSYLSFVLFTVIFILGNTNLSAQKNTGESDISPESLKQYEKQVAQLVNYLQGTLNFLGDPTQPAKEKEIIVNESYLKIFTDSEVQIEDDLDKNRDVPIYKNVQAYLKDIIFFYKSVSFEFIVTSTEHFVNENGEHYFLVTFNRVLKGITVNNDTVNWKQVRYMEINLNIIQSSLKIASIYTNKLNEKEDVINWWNSLTPEWRNIFGQNISITDSIKLSDIIWFQDSLIVIADKYASFVSDSTEEFSVEIPEERKTNSNLILGYDTLKYDTRKIFAKINGILNQTEIDVSENNEIRTLKPLSKLTRLQDINCSNTLITDVTPLRNLNELTTLNCSQTPVSDISPLQYSTRIKNLNCSYTLIRDMDVISNFIHLEKLWFAGNRVTDLSFVEDFLNLKTLDCSDSKVYDLEPLAELTKLEEIDISGSLVRDLTPLKNLINLERFNCSNTPVDSIEPLANLKNLEILHISNTGVTSLSAVSGLQNLKYIYCDNTEIKKEETLEFMREHPGCTVIFESEELMKNWLDLDKAWKDIIKKLADIGDNPTREELHRLIKATELDISGNREIGTLRPLRNLFNLKVLNISSVKATDFEYISNCPELEELDAANTGIEDLEFLMKQKKLKVLNIDSTSVGNLDPLEGLNELKIIYADNTNIDDKAAFAFQKDHPGCLIIYKTGELNKWWDGLPVQWQQVFSSQFKVDSPPSKEQLHRILFIDSLEVENNMQIKNLEPVKELAGLRSLSLVSTGVSDLSPLSGMTELENLTCKQGPVSDLSPIVSLVNLRYLNVESTPVSDLRPVSWLSALEVLICSGTQVKALKPLTNMTKLKQIEINNTPVRSIKPLFNLPALKNLKCFNTKISAKAVEKFKVAKPDCEVVYY